MILTQGFMTPTKCRVGGLKAVFLATSAAGVAVCMYSWSWPSLQGLVCLLAWTGAEAVRLCWEDLKAGHRQFPVPAGEIAVFCVI